MDIGNGRITSINTGVVKLGAGAFSVDLISMEAPIFNAASVPVIINASVPGGGLTNGYMYFNDTNGYRFALGPVLIEQDVTVRHIVTTSTSLPVAVAGVGACSGPTITVSAGRTDCKMQISVLSGTFGCLAGTIVTVTYNTPFNSTTPGVVFSAANSNAASLSNTTAPHIGSESATSFTFTSGSAGLTSSVTYVWNFQACA